MLESQPINSRLFEEATDGAIEASDECLQLSKALLLDALQRMKQAGTIHALRREMIALKDEVFNSDSSIRSNLADGDIVEFANDHLQGDFDQIVAAQTIERALYYIDRLIKSTTEVKANSINDLNLNRWKEYDDIYVDSLWMIDRRESSGVHTAGYWGNFIPQIPNQMMKRYTKKGEWVLDTFAGSGTTLIEGQRWDATRSGMSYKQMSQQTPVILSHLSRTITMLLPISPSGIVLRSTIVLC